MSNGNKHGIAIIGLGCVGTGLYSLIKNNPDFEVRGIAVKDRNKTRSVSSELIRYEYLSLIEDSAVQTVVEMIDDAEAALDIARRTLSAGKNLVSANKKMIAGALPELLKTARENHAVFRCEASVCGSIPVIQTLDNYLHNLEIQSVSGILNGSSNYILSQMWKSGIDFSQALKDAQIAGFAETDPTLDIEGFDAENKLSIMHSFAFNAYLPVDSILTYGISNVRFDDLNHASSKRLRLKPLAYSDNTGLSYVLPAFVSSNHPAYAVEDEYNLAIVDSNELAYQSYIGKGAGSIPTGKAVLEDVLAVNRGASYSLNLKEVSQKDSDVLNIYISSSGEIPIELPFQQLLENQTSSAFSYQIGTIRFADLKAYKSILQQASCFVALYAA